MPFTSIVIFSLFLFFQYEYSHFQNFESQGMYIHLLYSTNSIRMALIIDRGDFRPLLYLAIIQIIQIMHIRIKIS